MRLSLLVVATAALAAVAPATAATFTTAQVSNAAAGLQAMRELNAIVLGDMNAGHDVEGKTFVGGTLSGGGTFAIGNGSYGQAASNRSVLTVGRDMAAQINVNNGANGASGQNVVATAAENVVRVGGNSTGSIGMNGASSSLPGSVQTGGSFNSQNFNPSASKTAQYGTTASGVQAQDQAYVTRNAALANAQTGLSATIASETAVLRTNLSQLSDILADKTANATIDVSNYNDIRFRYDATAATADYVVVNLNAADLFSGRSGTFNLNLLGDGKGGYKTTIVNVLGTGSFNWAINAGNASLQDQNLIWNFNQSLASGSALALGTAFHGSVLASNLAVANSNYVDGTLVANSFRQGGELHLASFAGSSAIVTSATGAVSAVPEPASWAMMVAGFGLLGSALRRRPRGIGTVKIG